MKKSIINRIGKAVTLAALIVTNLGNIKNSQNTEYSEVKRTENNTYKLSEEIRILTANSINYYSSGNIVSKINQRF